MNSTVEIPVDLFKRVKAMAAICGENLKDFVTEALEEHLKRHAASVSLQRGWRSVFGQATPEEVASVDAVVAEELERVDPDNWQ